MESLLRRSEEGKRISEIAYTVPPIPVGKFTRTIQAIAYLLCVLATIIVGLRVYVRVKLSRAQRAWGWDDIFAVAGWVRQRFAHLHVLCAIQLTEIPRSFRFGLP